MRRMVKHQRQYCNKTGKQRYDTQAAADYHIWLMLYGDYNTTPIVDGCNLHSYHCDACGGFHIGHQQYAPVQAINPSTYKLSPEMAALGAALEVIEQWMKS